MPSNARHFEAYGALTHTFTAIQKNQKPSNI